ncbi:MAG: septal ring lytic transglycosylase RlpA family protein [Cuspidothrix sp.]
MNQRHLWSAVAAQTIITLTVLGLPLVGRTQTSDENPPHPEASPTSEAVKVGEYQSSTEKPISDTVITRIYPHSIRGLQAATLYVRDIPVLTFVGSTPVVNPATNNETKEGVVGNSKDNSGSVMASESAKTGKFGNQPDITPEETTTDNDPVQKASVIAARINELIDKNIDATKIIVSWKPGEKSSIYNKAQKPSLSVQKSSRDRYTIQIDGQELVEVNELTRLADTTDNLAQDALQATNRLRRLIGNASPINEIIGLPPEKSVSRPKERQEIAFGNVKLTFKGVASWYGYDGSGSRTASGERYNPEGLTAAHRTLPLGTKIRVTNTRNGVSVVVRINDRGPYIRGRILDLSAGAARILGVISTGLAPVSIEVLGR